MAIDADKLRSQFLHLLHTRRTPQGHFFPYILLSVIDYKLQLENTKTLSNLFVFMRMTYAISSICFFFLSNESIKVFSELLAPLY